MHPMPHSHVPTHHPFDPRQLLSALIAARRRAGLDQSELARRLDVTRQQVSYLESGNADLRTSTLSSWARALDLRLELVPNDEPLGVVVGLDHDARPLVVTLQQLASHALVLGSPGSGRSVAVANLTTALLDVGCSLLVVDLTADERLQTVVHRSATHASRAFHEYLAPNDPLTRQSTVIDLLEVLRRPTPAAAYLAAPAYSEHGPGLAAASFATLLDFDAPAPNPVAVLVEGAHLAPPDLLDNLLARGRASGVIAVLSAPAPGDFPPSSFDALVRNTNVMLNLAPSPSSAPAVRDLLARHLGADPQITVEELAALGIGEVLVALRTPAPSLRWCRTVLR